MILLLASRQLSISLQPQDQEEPTFKLLAKLKLRYYKNTFYLFLSICFDLKMRWGGTHKRKSLAPLFI